MSTATRRIACSPVPATGCGSRTRGTSGIPDTRATKVPWALKSSVTRVTTGISLRARAMPSRTVPVVQLPQWP